MSATENTGGLKAALLERLHKVGTRRDRSGNRELFFDQYCAFILLFLFNRCAGFARLRNGPPQWAKPGNPGAFRKLR